MGTLLYRPDVADLVIPGVVGIIEMRRDEFIRARRAAFDTGHTSRGTGLSHDVHRKTASERAGSEVHRLGFSSDQVEISPLTLSDLHCHLSEYRVWPE